MSGILLGNIMISRGVLGSIPAPTGLTLTLISGGVKIDWTDNSGGTAQTEIWARSDGGTSVLLTTKNAGIVTHNDLLDAVDLRYYKIRAKKGTRHSPFTAEQSIAMLSAEMVINGDFASAAGWDLIAEWTISGGKAHYPATAIAGMMIRYDCGFTTGHQYRMKYKISGGGGSAGFAIMNNAFAQIFTEFPTYLYHLNGSFERTLHCISSYAYLVVWAQYSYGAYDLDDLSIKEILFP